MACPSTDITVELEWCGGLQEELTSGFHQPRGGGVVGRMGGLCKRYLLEQQREKTDGAQD